MPHAAMDHAEVRAIRGSLSRAAFARILGVTALTVLRWELPEDSKEARRPRAKMVDTLRRLGAAGVGATGTPSDEAELEDDDAEASEPVLAPDARPTGVSAASLAGYADDESVVVPLLEHLCGERWSQAEDDLLALLSSNALRTSAGRTLATLGLVQAQILARMDVRGAFTVLLPILDDVERGGLPPAVMARALVTATMVFAAPDSRTFDLGRVNAYAARAYRLLPPDADDLRVFAATSRITAARFLGPDVTLHAYHTYAACLERATSPLARMLAGGLAGLVATIRNDMATSERHGGQALAAARACGFWGLVGGVLSDYAAQLLRGSQSPEVVLGIAQLARQCAESPNLAPTEGFVRVLAAECEALCRLGRLDDAHATANEALALAKRAGLARYALTVPLGRLCMFTDRPQQLEELAAAFEAESQGPQAPAARAQAAYLRALLLSLAGDFAGAAELCERVLSAPETTPGLEYLIHAAHFEIVVSHTMARDLDRAAAALRRAEQALELRPSIWHATMLRRSEALILMQRGQFGEARQRIESSSATFALLGDRVQAALEAGGMAMIAAATGAPNAAELRAAAFEAIERFGISTAFLKRRAAIITRPVTISLGEPSMTEKLLVALDRLSVQGLDPESFRRELGAVLRSLFPAREVLVGGAELEGLSTVVRGGPDASQPLLFGVRGEVDAEQQAALTLLASFASRAAAGVPAFVEPEAKLDGVLPSFIAASAVTRQLKGEIVRLSRSSATILISGESGSGKEVVARAVHDVSLRAEAPYVAFNCASVPRELFEGQLFGYRKGSFTGAVSDSPGVVRAADGGTLFLDEIGELPLEVQPKLLRFLENGEIFPLGEQKPKRVNVRVLAATHRDLGRLVQEGRFREDLYYRLNVVPLHVPPLRERKEDVTALARLFIERLVGEGAAPPTLASDAISALHSHTWPGNVRELRNVVERAMAYAPVPRVLSAQHLRIARA